jgi:hypothetical protein
MAVRVRGAAERGRAALGRAELVRFVPLALALYLAAGALAAWPALRDADDRYLARSAPAFGEPAAGDHLQLGYNLWLVGHQLGRGEAPWRDPYSFQPVVDPAPNLQGWLFGLPFWPLHAALGAVGAWNAFVLLSYVLAGGLACAWLRALGLGRGAALAGGLVFALAPYRVAQSTGHLLGPASALLPLALLAIERARSASRAWLLLAAAAVTAIPLSGQLHLALGAIPLVVAYALVRTRDRGVLLAVAAGAVAAVAAGVLVRETVIEGSVAEGGRPLTSVEQYSAEWSDLLARDGYGRLEELVFVGWATPLLALGGLVLLVRAGRIALAALLAAAAVVPILLALGTNLPTYELLYDALPPFRFPRVPERLMPIACLAIAALVAVAADRLHARAALVALVALLALDLRVDVYQAAAAAPDNRAYAALADRPAGLHVELPVFQPELHFASAYLAYREQAPRAGPAGYSTTAKHRANGLARRLRPLNCGGLTRNLDATLGRLGIRYATVHRGLYAQSPYDEERCAAAAARAFERRGWRRVAADGPVTLYER